MHTHQEVQDGPDASLARIIFECYHLTNEEDKQTRQ